MADDIVLKKDSYDSLLACYRALRDLAGYLYVHGMLSQAIQKQLGRVMETVEGADSDRQTT